MKKYVGFVLGLSLIVPTVRAEDGEAKFRHLIREEIVRKADRLPDITNPQPGDYAKDLVDQYGVWNLAKMEEKGLFEAELPVAPWTDSYWPTYMGGIANRYGDPGYGEAYDWADKERYLKQMLGRGGATELSPAEKYDLLIGDGAFTLTNSLVAEAAGAVGENGRIETWFGLCHGWAPASFMLPRPRRSVSVLAADGREIVFYPSDIKALATLLWAKSPGRTRFVGGRCDKSPDRDRRRVDPECFDNNPATWHLAVVNQIGLGRRSFVMDMDEGREVWNQPVYAYSYRYENPVTKKESTKLSRSLVALRDYKNDPYSRFRSPNADSVVNVRMSVTYVSENLPSHATVDGPENDSRSLIVFDYDLELDRNGDIVGGEWHSASHPDFLWVPVAGAEAKSVGDDLLFRIGDRASWAWSAPVPEGWREAAKVSGRYEQPLAKIVEGLIDRASR